MRGPFGNLTTALRCRPLKDTWRDRTGETTPSAVAPFWRIRFLLERLNPEGRVRLLPAW